MNKKKILFIVDVPNWAFDIEAKLLQKKLSQFYDIDILVSSEKKYNDDLYLILKDSENYDMIHVFFRKLISQLGSDEFKKHFDSNEEYIEYVKTISKKLSTGIYDHLFLEDETIDLYKPVFTTYTKMYYTASKRLENIYCGLSEKKGYPKPWGTIHDTFDGSLFSNNENRTFENKLVIGWVGNSKWNIKYQDFKGFNTIILPVIDELISEGYNIEKNFADKNIISRTNEEMPMYYDEIDICIIASSSEGTPRPLFEAMASGIVVITTDVGIVPEVLGPLAKSCVIGNRSILGDDIIKKNLKDKIIELYNNREQLKNISKENVIYGTLCDIDHTYLEYKKYFDYFLNNNE